MISCSHHGDCILRAATSSYLGSGTARSGAMYVKPTSHQPRIHETVLHICVRPKVSLIRARARPRVGMHETEKSRLEVGQLGRAAYRSHHKRAQ